MHTDVSPATASCLPRTIAAVSTKYTELSLSEIAREVLLTTQEVIQKYPDLLTESKIGVLAVKFARLAAFFGNDILKQCTPRGWQGLPALPQAELNMLKVT